MRVFIEYNQRGYVMGQFTFSCSIGGQDDSLELLATVRYHRDRHVLREMKRVGASIVHRGKTLSDDDINLLSAEDAYAVSVATRQSYDLDGIRKLLADQLQASERMWRDMNASSEGLPLQTCVADITITGISFDEFSQNMATQTPFLQNYAALHPDHYYLSKEGWSVLPSNPTRSLSPTTAKNGSKPLPTGVRYSTSKLCNILYAYELDRRLKRSGSAIAALAFDPGATPGTGFLRSMPKPVQWLGGSALMYWIMRRIGVTIGSVEFSGAGLAKVARDPAYADGSAKYFQSSDGRLIERKSSKMSYDEQRALKLWNDSKLLVHLDPSEEPVELR
jgi:NAD(P)-dependent dehydrogenase (short-subunit alcohol dehydrogenase family)